MGLNQYSTKPPKLNVVLLDWLKVISSGSPSKSNVSVPPKSSLIFARLRPPRIPNYTCDKPVLLMKTRMVAITNNTVYIFFITPSQ